MGENDAVIILFTRYKPAACGGGSVTCGRPSTVLGAAGGRVTLERPHAKCETCASLWKLRCNSSRGRSPVLAEGREPSTARGLSAGLVYSCALEIRVDA